MMRAYEPGERWVLDRMDDGTPVVADRDRYVIASLPEIEDRDEADAVIRLIAESPLRDELLHDIELWILDNMVDSARRLDDGRALLARIRDTLGRTE